LNSIEQRSLRGTILGLLSFGLNIIYSLLLVPFFLKYWGDIKYGYFLMAYAFIQLLRTLDNGHQLYVGNEFNKYYHTDTGKAYKILSSSVIIALCLGFFELLLFLGLWQFNFIEYVLGPSLLENENIFWGLFSMILMWWIVGSVGGILAKIILAKGLYAESVLFAMLIKGIEIGILITAILLSFSISTTFTLIAIATLLYSIIVFYWTFKRMPEYFPWWRGWDIRIGFKNFKRSIVITLNGFFDQLSNNGLLFIITRYLGIAAIPVFTTLRTLSNTITMLTNLIVQPLVPEMIRYDSQGQLNKVSRVLEMNWFFGGLFINVSFLLFIPFAENLFFIWTNHQIEFNKQLFYTLMLSVIAINFGKGIQSYLAGVNNLVAISVISFLRMFVIFIVSILFIRSIGIISIGLGILLSEIVCSIVLPVYIVKKVLHSESFPPLKIWSAVLPLFIISCCILLNQFELGFEILISLFGLFLLLLIYYLQWMKMDADLKNRFKNLFLKKFSQV
jgi:O-antigen/teichoic acid export membrane protein